MHNQNRMQASLISTPAIHTALTDEITFAIFLSQGGDYEHDGCNRGKPKGIAMPSESNPAPMAPDFLWAKLAHHPLSGSQRLGREAGNDGVVIGGIGRRRAHLHQVQIAVVEVVERAAEGGATQVGHGHGLLQPQLVHQLV